VCDTVHNGLTKKDLYYHLNCLICQIQSTEMSIEYLSVVLAAVICVLMSTEASGQPTTDDDGTCDRGLPTSEQVANIAHKVDRVFDKVLALNPQQPACTTTPVDQSKRALVSALQCEYRSHVINFCLYLVVLFARQEQSETHTSAKFYPELTCPRIHLC